MNWNDIVPGVVAIILAMGSIFVFLKQQALDKKKKSDHISALVDLLHNTQVENINLIQENQELKSRLQQCIYRGSRKKKRSSKAPFLVRKKG